MKKLLFFLLVTGLLFGGYVNRSDSDYHVVRSQSSDIIFPEEYEKEAATVLSLIDALQSNYEKQFGFELDERLKIVLASSNNQIANAFAIPVLNNTTVFYGAGSSMADYFASKSWLRTLMIHEIAHTYQLSAKDSRVSQRLHRVFGSNYLPILPGIPLPLFTYPNLLLPTFMLEGNSVLNESRFGNGGRLYSGRAKALFYTLLKEGKLNATRMKNDHLDFPFTEEKYIVGGFFYLYLDMVYGTGRVNDFFKTHSRHYINPLLLSHSFVTQFHTTFERVYADFLDYFRPEAAAMSYLKGKELGFSRSFCEMNREGDRIHFYATDLLERPVISTLDRQNGEVARKSGSWLEGKPFLIDGRFYTAASLYTSYDKLEYALIDEDMNVYPGSRSKHVLDRKNGSTLYVDIPRSFDEPLLFKDGKFVARANSSALTDEEGSVYYFVQKKKKRILFKNRTPLFYLQGYWGKVVDIGEKGEVYFIASSRYGASLFMFQNGQVVRMSDADNIIDAKVLNSRYFLAETLQADGYRYILAAFETSDDGPVNVVYPFEKEAELDVFAEGAASLPDKREYGEVRDIGFTTLYPYYSYSSTGEDELVLSADFSDPIYFNTLSAYYYNLPDMSALGAGYENSRYRVTFGFGGYSILDKPKEEGARDYGSYGYLDIPLFYSGRTEGSLQLYGYQDDEDMDKNPLILSWHHTYAEHYGLAMDYTRFAGLVLYGKTDRDQQVYGGSFRYTHGLPWESFIKLSTQYSKSNESAARLSSEVEVYEDVTDIYMSGLDYSYRANRISKVGVALETVINLQAYYLYFPLSLRRGAIFGQYDQVELEGLDGSVLTIDEQAAGVNFDLLFIHKIPFAATLKYIKNSESQNDHEVIFGIGYDF